jgi:hypothetical protein
MQEHSTLHAISGRHVSISQIAELHSLSALKSLIRTILNRPGRNNEVLILHVTGGSLSDSHDHVAFLMFGLSFRQTFSPRCVQLWTTSVDDARPASEGPSG